MTIVQPLISTSLSFLPTISHGFFTRQGGVSAGLYAGLNCGPGSGDDPANVAANRAKVAESLGVLPANLMSAYQCHTALARTVDRPFIGDAPSVDALATATPGLAIGILAADCGPVLLATGDGKVIGAAHAGWKGALGGILENTIAAMEQLGAERRDIHACLGPCIAQASYEVGAEMRQAFTDADSGHAAFFEANESGRFQFDLQGFILHRLRQAGIRSAEAVHVDTYSDPARFYSYRRTTHANESAYGRQISAIAIVK